MNLMPVCDCVLRRQLLRFIWKKWKLHRKLLKTKALTVGGEFSRHSIRRRAFVAWRISLEKCERKRAVQMQTISMPFSNFMMKKRLFQKWKFYLENEKISRDIQIRSDLTWNKVQSWLSNGNNSNFK
jgi:hypothetical protein